MNKIKLGIAIAIVAIVAVFAGTSLAGEKAPITIPGPGPHTDKARMPERVPILGADGQVVGTVHRDEVLSRPVGPPNPNPSPAGPPKLFGRP